MLTSQFEGNVKKLCNDDATLIKSIQNIKQYIMDNVKNNNDAENVKKMIDGLNQLLFKKREFFILYETEGDIDALLEGWVNDNKRRK